MSATILGGLLLVAVVALLIATLALGEFRVRATTSERRAAQLEKELAASRAAVAELRGSRGLMTPGAIAARQLEALNQAPAKRETNGEPGRVPWQVRDNTIEPSRAANYAKVTDAIATRTRGDWRLGRHLRGVADELLAAGFDHATVARRILEGDPVDA